MQMSELVILWNTKVEIKGSLCSEYNISFTDTQIHSGKHGY
jgi:hypothetical protein